MIRLLLKNYSKSLYLFVLNVCFFLSNVTSFLCSSKLLSSHSNHGYCNKANYQNLENWLIEHERGGGGSYPQGKTMNLQGCALAMHGCKQVKRILCKLRRNLSSKRNTKGSQYEILMLNLLDWAYLCIIWWHWHGVITNGNRRRKKSVNFTWLLQMSHHHTHTQANLPSPSHQKKTLQELYSLRPMKI